MDHKKAQIGMIEETLKWAGVTGETSFRVLLPDSVLSFLLRKRLHV